MMLFRYKPLNKKVMGTISYKECPKCHTVSYWELCTIVSWLTFLFIPLFPHEKKYCLACDECNYYIELKREEFNKIKNEILTGAPIMEPEAIKYLNKNPIQINYIKTLQQFKR